MAKTNKVDLTILKKLVGELESTLSTADAIATSVEPDAAEHVVELSKAAGLCSGIMQEAALLVMDVQMTMRSSQAPASDKSGNLLDTITALISPTKGGGGNSQN